MDILIKHCEDGGWMEVSRDRGDLRVSLLELQVFYTTVFLVYGSFYS